MHGNRRRRNKRNCFLCEVQHGRSKGYTTRNVNSLASPGTENCSPCVLVSSLSLPTFKVYQRGAEWQLLRYLLARLRQVFVLKGAKNERRVGMWLQCYSLTEAAKRVRWQLLATMRAKDGLTVGEVAMEPVCLLLVRLAHPGRSLIFSLMYCPPWFDDLFWQKQSAVW